MHLCDYIYLNRILYDGQRSLPINNVNYTYNSNQTEMMPIKYLDEFHTSDELYDPWWDSITIKYDKDTYGSGSEEESEIDYNSS